MWYTIWERSKVANIKPCLVTYLSANNSATRNIETSKQRHAFPRSTASRKVQPIIIIIKSFYSLWSMGHPWRNSRHCGLDLPPWPCSMIFLCFLAHPLLSFATFSLASLSFDIPEDSSLMQFPLLLLFLYVMCVQSNSIFFFLSDCLLTTRRQLNLESGGYFSTCALYCGGETLHPPWDFWRH